MKLLQLVTDQNKIQFIIHNFLGLMPELLIEESTFGEWRTAHQLTLKGKNAGILTLFLREVVT